MQNDKPGLTLLGKLFSLLMIVGLIVLGMYVFERKKAEQAVPRYESSSETVRDEKASDTDTPDLMAELQTEVPSLPPAQPYVAKDNIVEVELSEYAGYAGLIVANGGLEPNDQSYFTRTHGFKVKLTLSEEESWPALNSGKLAASATTADVLPVYGHRFQVTVPAQIGFSRGADGIIVRSEIKRINDLKGKVVSSSQFTEADFFIRYLAQEAGLTVSMLPDLSTRPDPQAVNLVYCTDAFAAGDLFLDDVMSGKNRLAGCVTWAPKTTEVVDQSDGRARLLTSNKNLLIVADVLIVNRGFAEQNPKIVDGLVDGLLHGNQLVRNELDRHIDVIAKAFNWTTADVREEMAKIHLSNLPENLAFFSGAIDAAGSFGGIYQSAVYAYGKALIPSAPDAERFMDLSALKRIEALGTYKDQTVQIAPIRQARQGPVEQDPLLSKDIRFFFEPNSAKLDMANASNLENLQSIKQLLQVSPGSTILLRGHVDDAMVPEFRKQGGEAFVRQMALQAMELSKNRAGEVRNILLSQYKVAAERLQVTGRGWEEPVSDKSEQNRRVEVYWFTVE